MNVHQKVRRKLVSELLRENAEYRKNAGNRRMCITPDSLDNSVYETKEFLKYQAELGLGTLDDLQLKEVCRGLMQEQINNQTGIIREWFHENYEDIIYDMNSRIPWPIIVRMRERLGRWALENTNPFNESIGSLIEETMGYVGLNPDNYDSHEEMWDVLKSYRR